MTSYKPELKCFLFFHRFSLFTHFLVRMCLVWLYNIIVVTWVNIIDLDFEADRSIFADTGEFVVPFTHLSSSLIWQYPSSPATCTRWMMRLPLQSVTTPSHHSLRLEPSRPSSRFMITPLAWPTSSLRSAPLAWPWPRLRPQLPMPLTAPKRISSSWTRT